MRRANKKGVILWLQQVSDAFFQVYHLMVEMRTTHHSRLTCSVVTTW